VRNPPPDPLHRFIGAFLLLHNLLGTRLLGQPDENVREVVFDRLVLSLLVVGNEVVDLGLSHTDLVVHLPLAQPGKDNLCPYLLAELVERDTVALQRAAEFRKRHFVAFGDTGNGCVELQVVDLQAGLTRQLQLRALDDHPLEHLPLQIVPVGQRRTAAAQLALCQRYPF
jgi:hypothetical protein